MQTLVLQRPDLANAQFDFQSDNGTIKVMSDGLNDSDKAWLQKLLNSNGTLVQAVQSFHDDAVAGYTTFAEVDNQPLTSSETGALSKQADGLASFMSLLQTIGAEAQSLLKGADGTNYAPDGATLNFEQPSTAIGFLSFMQST
jgi:hypothetical protein